MSVPSHKHLQLLTSFSSPSPSMAKHPGGWAPSVALLLTAAVAFSCLLQADAACDKTALSRTCAVPTDIDTKTATDAQIQTFCTSYFAFKRCADGISCGSDVLVVGYSTKATLLSCSIPEPQVYVTNGTLHIQVWRRD